MEAGLLTPEEAEAHEQKKAYSRAWQKEWRDNRKAAEPPKPPKPLSQNEIIKRKYAGLSLTDDEYAIYRAWQDKKTVQARERRHRIKASEPPKEPKSKIPTKKDVMNDIIARKNAGLELTPEEAEAYAMFREETNVKNKIWRDSKAIDKPQPLFISEIARRSKAGLSLTPEETAAYDSWREKKSEYQREWREKNKDYQKEWRTKNKAADLPMAANQ
jgi:hypothetical protein